MKKILAVLLSALLVLGVFPLVAFAEDEPEIPEGYTPIYTTEDLDNIRLNMSGKYILMNDIVFTEADYQRGGDFYNSGKGWVPIGNNTASSYNFKGTFDGNDHVIYNLRVNNPGADYQGLFGYVSGGTIKNVILYNASINGNNEVGGIVGYKSNSSSGSITNCDVYGAVSGKECVGGICGLSSYNISLCNNFADVSGTRYVGGINGRQNNCNISKSVNYGNVNSSSYYAGGISGECGYSGSYQSGTFYISYSYNVGTVTSNVTDSSFGLARFSGTYASSAYSVGQAYNGYSSNKCYYLDESVDESQWSGEGCRSEDQLKKQSNYEGWDFTNVWTIDKNAEYPYPTLRENPKPFEPVLNCDHENTSLVGEKIATCTEDGSTGDVVCMTCGRIIELGTVLPALGHIGEWIVTVEPTDYQNGEKQMVCERCGQSVTDIVPALIYPVDEGWVPVTTKQELDNVRLDMNGKYILMNDIVFTDDDYASTGEFYNSGKGWSPIGTSAVPFTGHFNGNGKTISGLYINDENGVNIGLFGYLTSNAKVENVSLTEVDFTANSKLGGIAGYGAGTFNNCSVSGSLYASDNNCGGICGYASSAKFTNCWFIGNVTSNCNNAGGIAGTAAYGSITECQSYGTVEAEINAGGIVGYLDTSVSGTATISVCRNSATVSGANAGGIVGNNYLGYNTDTYPLTTSPNTAYGRRYYSAYATITNCYNYGSVEGKENAAGIIGFQHYKTGTYSTSNQVSSLTSITSCYNVGIISSSTLEEGDETEQQTGGIVCSEGERITCSPYCYYLDQALVGAGNDYGTAKSDDQLVKQATYTNWDFETVWTIDSTAEYPYPTFSGVEIPEPYQPCDHSETELQGYVAATCGTNGYSGDTVCTLCGKTVVTGHSIPATGAHTYGKWEIVTAATCSQNGLKKRVCSSCGAIEEEVLPATGAHTYGEWEIVTTATCTQSGIKKRVCSSCGAIDEQVITSSGAHTYGEWQIVTAANCIENGLKKRVCSACGDIKEEIIPATGNHTFGDWIIVSPASCTEAGEQKRICSSCGAVETAVLQAFGSHTPGAATETVIREATCTVSGEKLTVVKCLVCGNTVSETRETVNPLGHSYTKTVTPATCTSMGYTTYTCVRGDHEYKADYTDVLHHKDDNNDGMCDYGCGTEVFHDGPSDPGSSGDPGSENVCAYCGQVHTGFFGGIVGFFHNILNFFKNLF